MKMAFVSIDDPADLTSWSGIVVSMKAALEEQFESLVAIGPLETYHSSWYRLKRKLYERAVAARPTDRCNLVWIGTDGGRRRSGFAVEVVNAPNQQGLPTHLTIIGIEPEPPIR